jgi:hypothetical protein
MTFFVFILKDNVRMGKKEKEDIEFGEAYSSRLNELPESLQKKGTKIVVRVRRIGGYPSPFCGLCGEREQDACFIHGRLSHLACCYKCAKHIYRETRICIVCNRTIDKVTRNILG